MAAVTRWDFWVGQLRASKCRFRMLKRSSKPYIFVREVVGGETIRTFSSGVYFASEDEHIEACGKECLEAHKRGYWIETKKQGAASLKWEQLAEITLTNLRSRIARQGSRKNAEGHLREIGKLKGKVSVKLLKEWALLRSPINQPSAFRNRIETISHIDKAVEMDLGPLLAELRAMKPTGAAKKEQDRRTQKIRAIPEDSKLEAWLDRLEGHEQWLCAVIATYGLRPSEAWHAERIDEDGWIHIPGDGITKTERHYAPPQPAHWLERYQLRENFKQHQAAVNARWSIKWEERNGQKIPTNNSQVTNSFYSRIQGDFIPKLWVGDEWVRPYDLRHSYAIRCETSQDPELLATSSGEFARWLGHTYEIHKRVYLKHMRADRLLDSMKSRVGSQKPAAQPELSEEILKKLEKLEQLEKLLAS